MHAALADRRAARLPPSVLRGGVLALLLPLLGSVAAQTASFGLVAADGGGGATARVQGLPHGPVTVDAWARVGGGVAGGGLVRWTETFGPLGNVIIEASLDAALGLTGPGSPSGARAALGARGVIGPIAASLRVDAGTVHEDDLEATVRAELGRRALRGAPGAADVGLRGSLTYRPDRTTLLTVDPRVRWTPGDWSTWTVATLRQSAVTPEFDLWLGAEGGLVAGTAAAGLGAGLVWTRRREPDSSLRVWLGSDGGGVRPGLEAAFAGRGPGSSATLSLAWVPYRLDAPAWRVALDAAVAATDAPGTWRLAAAAAGSPLGTRWSLSLGLERPLAPAAP